MVALRTADKKYCLATHYHVEYCAATLTSLWKWMAAATSCEVFSQRAETV